MIGFAITMATVSAILLNMGWGIRVNDPFTRLETSIYGFITKFMAFVFVTLALISLYI